MVKWAAKGLIALFILALVVSLYSVVGKISIEQKNRVVEISVPMHEVEALSRITGRRPVEILEEFRSAGLTSLAVEETTVKDMMNRGKILVLNGWQLLDYDSFFGVANNLVRDILSQKDFNPRSYYIFTKDREIYRKLKTAMASRGYDINAAEGGGIYVIQEVKGAGGFTEIGLGIDLDSLENARSLGLNIVVMLKGVKEKTAEEIKLLDELFDREMSVLVLQNNEMPRKVEAAELLLKAVKGKSIRLGLDEFKEAGNLKKFLQQNGYNAVRVYNRPPHRWMEEYLLAVRDRNDRLLYLHLFMSGDEDLVSYNKMHIKEIYNDVISRDFIAGVYPQKASVFSKTPTSTVATSLLPIMASMGLGLGVYHLLKLSGVLEKTALAVSYALILAMGLFAALDFSTFRSGASLLASVLYPCLGIYREMTIKRKHPSNYRQALKEGIFTLLRATGIAATGALLITGISGDVDFILGIEKFRGIKAMYISSFIIIALLYIKLQHGSIPLRKPVLSIGNLIAVALAGGILYILINRTGNFSVIPIPKWELYFRIWLEEVLPVRPRTKEFLIGFPALVLAGGLKNTERPLWSRLLMVTGLLGEVSMVNTFSHYHVNALISIIRSVEGLILGGFIGALALGGYYICAGKGMKANE
ncbi:DUF5693 family protein [Thermosediminibacter litoriperuensis]|uniref:Uncharacterized protein n=1 Tax=Thermosediminibacter litoriperuensis TaxID=291989 RepID=A0A5S5AYF5_9FIRM|nr:DUF5693 family protein [Thermosediminibacter litoriperuensis]TYP57816.1 hypothetical protein LZ11_00474 [Thermosediminibacter litoriperuensis]